MHSMKFLAGFEERECSLLRGVSENYAIVVDGGSEMQISQALHDELAVSFGPDSKLRVVNLIRRVRLNRFLTQPVVIPTR